MNRRQLLEWLSRGLAAAVAAVVGLPGLKYLTVGTASSPDQPSQFLRLKRLNDLPIGRPILVPVYGSKQDAWSRSERQVVGRIWLVRGSEQPDAAPSDLPRIRAFNSVCPHMGCQIQSREASQGFVCPCHRAAFGLDGQRTTDAKTGERNHAPRDLDGLNCRIVQDSGSDDAWVEVQWQSFELGLQQQVVRS